jgi:transcriptional regulator with XRE-family HTH domain
METKNTILVQFGRNIRSAREAKGLSQEELAFHAGLDRTYVGGVERGERNISLLNICRLAAALGADMSDLVLGLSNLDKENNGHEASDDSRTHHL